MNYELGLIVNPNVPETDHKGVEERVLGYLKNIKAKVVRDFYSLGRRKLAYPIKKQKHGFYLFVEFAFEEDEAKAIKALDHELKLDNNILRHLIVKRDKPATDTEVVRWQQVSKPEMAKKTRRPMTTRGPRPIAKKLVAKPAEAASNITLDDIDKKLDEILAKEPKLD